MTYAEDLWALQVLFLDIFGQNCIFYLLELF